MKKAKLLSKDQIPDAQQLPFYFFIIIKMKLITKTLEERFEQIGSQDGKYFNSIVIAKYFDPVGCWTWYATEYDPETGIFYGFVIGAEAEWGSFSLADLRLINQERLSKPGLKVGIERDLYCIEEPLFNMLISEGYGHILQNFFI